ncbi:MAG: hypothetical protein WCZ28_02700 [Burkholderiaceae bacterium]
MTRLIVAIGWMYVVVLMAATQDGWLAAIGTLVFYGLLPLGVVLYLLGTAARARRRRMTTGRDPAMLAADARGTGPDSGPGGREPD